MSVIASQCFKFKQFGLWQHLCAMKVSTDGVALGAWAQLGQAHNGDNITKILDIGTGTGLLSLMLAQRYTDQDHIKHHTADELIPPSFTITAIEIDKNAATQAQFNIAKSPWSSHIDVVNQALSSWISPDCEHEKGQHVKHRQYDHIICNPPYFSDSLTSASNDARNVARHNDSLPFSVLVDSVLNLLSPDGHFDLILPIDESQRFVDIATTRGLRLQQLASLQHSSNKTPTRYLMRFELSDVQKPLPLLELVNSECERIVVRNNEGGFHASFATYTHPFYLKL